MPDWSQRDWAGQRDLARCCRVSKALCALAQPVLWRHVYVPCHLAPPVFKPELAALTRTLVITLGPDQGQVNFNASEFSPADRIAVWLVYFTNLHWFHVSRFVFRATSPFCLNNLVRLELVHVILDPPDLLATLTPAHLLSLRAFLVLDGDGIIPSLLNPALLSQLECVQVEVTGRYQPPEDNGTPTLFFVYPDLLGASPANLAPPDELLPSSTETSASYAESVVALCRQRSVSVHWVRDMPQYSIVPGFWDYAKELKAKGEV
ncbi:hypothetical protein JCM3770_000996 [Rhodotorula araucariae]